MGIKKEKKTKFGDAVKSDFHRAKQIVMDLYPDGLEVRYSYGSYYDKASYENGSSMMALENGFIQKEQITNKLNSASKNY
jgi:hypothetical protein